MIDKILNRYFTHQAKRIMTQKLAILSIDKKWVKRKFGYELYVKKRPYNDKFYKFAYEVRFEDGFERCLQWYNANRKEICDYVIEVLVND